MPKFLTALLLLLTLGFSAVRPVGYLSPKRMAMGGAGVAVVNKEDSFLYNPAHAVKIKNSLTLPPLLLLPNVFYCDSETPDALNKFSQGTASENAIDAYRRIIPSSLGFGANWAGGWVYTPDDYGTFAVSGYADGRLDIKVLNRLAPRLDGTAYFDFVFPALTYASEVELANYTDNPADLFLTELQIGLTLKKVTRMEIFDSDNGSDFSLSVIDFLDEDNPSGINARVGNGIGLDIGALGQMDTFLGETKIGLTISNLFNGVQGTAYENMNSEELKTEEHFAQQLPVAMTLGLAVQASPFTNLGWLSFLQYILPNAVYAADLDIVTPDKSFFKRLHLGLEQSYFSGLLDWRMGLNQGYPTMGLNCNLGWYHLGFTYYTEELGAEVGRNPHSYYVLHSGFVF